MREAIKFGQGGLGMCMPMPTGYMLDDVLHLCAFVCAATMCLRTALARVHTSGCRAPQSSTRKAADFAMAFLTAMAAVLTLLYQSNGYSPLESLAPTRWLGE